MTYWLPLRRSLASAILLSWRLPFPTGLLIRLGKWLKSGLIDRLALNGVGSDEHWIGHGWATAPWSAPTISGPGPGVSRCIAGLGSLDDFGAPH
jgi:hypothetical protein